jgi:hypothetical protein
VSAFPVNCGELDPAVCLELFFKIARSLSFFFAME